MNKSKTVIYIGSTTNLRTRVIQHKTKFYSKSFTAKYNVNELVYFESFFSIQEARAREHQIKGYVRKKKLVLIMKNNPDLRDLFSEIEDFD